MVCWWFLHGCRWSESNFHRFSGTFSSAPGSMRHCVAWGLRHLRATWKPTVWIHLGPAQSSLEVKANIQKPKWGWFILGFNTWCGKVVGRCCAMLCVCVCVLFGIFTEMIKYVDRCKQINAYLQVVRLRRSLFGFNEGQRTANNHAPYTNPPNAKHGDLFLLLRVILVLVRPNNKATTLIN